MLRPYWPSVLLLPILLLGLGLRLAPWGYNRFLEDEALYAAWGLQIATGADSMLNEEPVDKPPLHPYTLAFSFLLFASPPVAGEIKEGHPIESAARLPSLLASVTSIALVYALARALFPLAPGGRGEAPWAVGQREATALLAALLLAVSPFDLLFASTAFTDPLMTAFVLGSLLAAARDHLGAAGILVGLAAATKQQALLFLPLVVAVVILSPVKPRRVDEPPNSAVRAWLGILFGQRWVRFGLGFALVCAAVLWWDAARVQRPGFLEQSLISYGGLGLSEPGTLIQRASDWLRLAADFWVSPRYNTLMAGAIALWLAGGVAGWWSGASGIEWALVLFAAGFLLLHWLVGFQVWDRYLLGLVPLVALLAARAFVGLGVAIRAVRWRWVYGLSLGLALVFLLASPVVHAARSELPVGGDHGAYDGIEQVADYLRAHAPPGSVLYHRWLGYHYRLYLYGEPLRLHWYPDLADLVHDATVYRREPRYIAFPSWRDRAPAEAALAEAGIRLVPVLETTRRNGTVSFRLYRMEGP